MTTQTDPRLDDPRRPKAAPVELAGKWVAWNFERTEIISSGDDFATVCDEAKAAGHERPVLEVT